MKRNKYKGIYVFKGYGHFDNKKLPKDFINYVEDSNKIIHHPFMPFILDMRRYRKFNKKNGRTKKERPICFSAHLDRYIYQRYGYLLNQKYNKYAKEHGIDDCAVAYRSKPDEMGRTNIEISKEVFCKIKDLENCFILVGDFKSFFDRLEHKFLKEMLCLVLNTEKSELPIDYYKVYKSMTKYAYFDMKDIVGMLRLNKKDIYKSDRIFNIQDFRQAKKTCLKTNKNSYGIPQGSPIISVFSNIYMIKADELINKKIKEYGGIYRRYSDDILLVIPNNKREILKEIYEYITSVLQMNGNPELEENKTKVFSYKSGCVKDITDRFFDTKDTRQDIIEYLGFTFDGKQVTIRDKSYSKFCYRMYKKIDTINRQRKKLLLSNSSKKRVGTTELYDLYSSKGNSNFLSYIDRVEEVYSETGLFNFHKDRIYKKIKDRIKY